jgi:hypothetical protein
MKVPGLLNFCSMWLVRIALVPKMGLRGYWIAMAVGVIFPTDPAFPADHSLPLSDPISELGWRIGEPPGKLCKQDRCSRPPSPEPGWRIDKAPGRPWEQDRCSSPPSRRPGWRTEEPPGKP